MPEPCLAGLGLASGAGGPQLNYVQHRGRLQGQARGQTNTREDDYLLERRPAPFTHTTSIAFSGVGLSSGLALKLASVLNVV